LLIATNTLPLSQTANQFMLVMHLVVARLLSTRDRNFCLVPTSNMCCEMAWLIIVEEEYLYWWIGLESFAESLSEWSPCSEWRNTLPDNFWQVAAPSTTFRWTQDRATPVKEFQPVGRRVRIRDNLAEKRGKMRRASCSIRLGMCLINTKSAGAQTADERLDWSDWKVAGYWHWQMKPGVYLGGPCACPPPKG